jgi:hypothetical protein
MPYASIAITMVFPSTDMVIAFPKREDLTNIFRRHLAFLSKPSVNFGQTLSALKCLTT